MTATQTLSGSPPRPSPTSSADTLRARAYCGPAHGTCWMLDAEAPPPTTVELGSGGQLARYLLVHHPRTRLPARDHLGNYLYMPLNYGYGT